MRRVLVAVGVACFVVGLVGCKGSSSAGGKNAPPTGADEMKAQQKAGAPALKAASQKSMSGKKGG